MLRLCLMGRLYMPGSLDVCVSVSVGVFGGLCLGASTSDKQQLISGVLERR